MVIEVVGASSWTFGVVVVGASVVPGGYFDVVGAATVPGGSCVVVVASVLPDGTCAVVGASVLPGGSCDVVGACMHPILRSPPPGARIADPDFGAEFVPEATRPIDRCQARACSGVISTFTDGDASGRDPMADTKPVGWPGCPGDTCC